jgi:isopentenyl-diphosphate Delta-isomerase
MELVVLVDEDDRELGVMEKIEAHQKALLHRAFSVFIFNGKNEMLLQQRAFTKYHSSGLWSNACCSHPRPNENPHDAAIRRLEEEMGFTTELNKAFSFVYKTNFDNGLTEHEYDHVFLGQYESEIRFNTDEVNDYCFKKIEEIEEEMKLFSDKYTSWFQIAFPRVKEYVLQTQKVI